MTKDLSLTVVNTQATPPTTSTQRLSWATSMFYFGMLAGLYPMTFALQRFNIGRILGGVVVVWAGICMLTAAVSTYEGLYAQRFFLGFVESIIPTGFMCIVSGYYTQEEQALRQSWYVLSDNKSILLLTNTQVVCFDWSIYHYWWCAQLWIRPNHRWRPTQVAVHLYSRWLPHLPLRHLVFIHPQLARLSVVPHSCRAHSRG